MRPASKYVGRFAPSPTGPLHFGSLIAAVGSYLQAKSQRGRWLVRIEDLDPPRESPGASTQILRTLEAFGFVWDGAVTYQSQRREHYEHALKKLAAGGHIFLCGCSRQEIRANATLGEFGPVYPGICRVAVASGRRGRVVRAITHDKPIGFDDPVAGFYAQRLESQIGDFVIKRRDGYIAYQLAVVVDDAGQRISEVVRGADLLDSTPRQIYLQGLLGVPTPRYVHLPVAVNVRGKKLSKHTHAPALDTALPQQALIASLQFLGQNPPAELVAASVAECWQWAIAHWALDQVPKTRQICYDDATSASGATSRRDLVTRKVS
ncbi:MAG: tRNA glutamyl-Q(34) synthetase GluQRS [Gammaproteobacteria bacterium]